MKHSAPMTPEWQNWSGAVSCAPTQYVTPQDQDALVSLVKSTTGPLRVHGAGHSFSPVASTDGTLISLEQMPGDVLATHAPQTATLQAGASLHDLSRALHAQGLAFKNLGDIDVQTLAGATQTATHGTGKTLPCLSAEIRAMRLLTAAGDILTINEAENTDLLDAARVALGTLGIVLDADVALRPAFKLHRRAELRPRKTLLADAITLWDTHRNFEAFVLPFCDYALCLTHDETDRPDMHDNPGDDDAMLDRLRLLRTLTKRLPWVRRRIMNAIAKREKPEDRIGDSFALLASERNVRFHEMEYHLPVDRGLAVLDEILTIIEREQRDVFFPIELRMTAGDTGWLSPFEGAPRISLAVHAHQRDDYFWFFTKLEPIFRANGGRPHWGKLHSLRHGDLDELYPRISAFRRLRAEMDPGGRFLNPHLTDLLGGQS